MSGEAAPAALMALNGEEVRERFDEITNGIKGAIDFLRTNLHVGSMKNLPFGTLIVPLSVFFSAPGNTAVACSGPQRLALLRWFWRACFSRRYSSDVIRKLELDIGEMLKLKAGEESALGEFDWYVEPEFFLNSTFNTYGVNTKSAVLLLAQYDPRSFKSGAPVRLVRVLKDYNRNEFHHVYPRRYLKDQGYEAAEINRLANFVFMSRADNNALGGVAPSEYRSKMYEPAIAGILEHALCPESVFDDRYLDFLRDRAEMLANAARELCTDGDPHSVSEVVTEPGTEEPAATDQA